MRAEAEYGNRNDSDVTGEELYRRFLAGDSNAFEDLVALYEDELSRFINGIVHDRHETKHLTIEAFAQLALGGKGYSGKAALKTYLFTIGKNLATRYVRTRGKEKHISFEEALGTFVDGSDSPYEFMEREENRRLVHEALQELKAEYHAVLALLYFEDMSYREAGQSMKKSENQVKHLAYRAKKALKKRLEDEGYAANQ